MDPRYNELLARLDRSECELKAVRRQSRAMRWGALLSMVGAVTFLGTRPAATQGQIDAYVRAGTGVRIKAPLTIVDSANRPIVQIGSNALGRGMALFDATGKMLCGLGETPQGRGVAIFDAQQKRIAVLGEGSAIDGSASGRGVVTFDSSEKLIALLGTGQNGEDRGRGLTVNDDTGAPVAGLGVWPQRPDRGQLVLTDRERNPIFSQPALP